MKRCSILMALFLVSTFASAQTNLLSLSSQETAVITSLSLPARAQTGGCSVMPLFSVVPGNPVQLSFTQSTQAQLSKPVVSIAGSEITVVQNASDANQYPFPACNSQSISLGTLPQGSYNVTWKYQTSPSTVLETFHFAFTLADAPPCTRG